MKFNYKFFLTVLAILAMWGFNDKLNAQGQDTLVVEWSLDGGQTVAVNNLRDVILADTNRPTGRVYKLKQGGYYQISERIENDGFHLRIVGEKGGATDLENPPVIQMAPREDGSVDGRIITGLSSITLKNLWITGITTLGDQGSYEPMTMSASNARFVIDNVIFDRSNFAMMAFYGTNNDIFFTNCSFRNLIGNPSSQQWEGRAISIWADQDSVLVENNTFFNIGMTVLQIEGGAANYVLFNHNTVINLGRNINTGSNWHREGYFTNNLIVNGWWHGEGYTDYSSAGRDPLAYNAGIFGIADLPSKYGPEEGRRVLYANNSMWLAPEFTAYYADTIRAASFIDPVTRIEHIDRYDNQIIKDSIWADPGLATYTNEIYPDMIQNINELRAGTTPAKSYFWKLVEFDGEICYECVAWPLEENFSYTNSQLLTAGTDGLPLGDLNWFPNSKTTYLANRAVEIEKIKNLAGPVITYNVQDEAQAEDGTFGGTASVLEASGQTYYDMSSGFIEWEFELPATGVYDLNVLVDLNGRATSGVNFFVNGFEIHDTRGWGQYVFGNDASSVHPNFPSSGLEWWLITEADLIEVSRDGATPLHLEAGTTKIQIKASWCDNLFGGIDILESGTSNIVKSLTAADVTSYSIASPGIVGAPWTPLYFKSVDLGTNGSVTVSFDAPVDGHYVIQPFYQNFSGESSGKITVDGTEVGTYTFAFDADSVGVTGLSSDFLLTKGTHDITLSGSNVFVDYIQLIQQSITSISERDELPNGFSLSQNYPNPFNPTTQINFDLGEATSVKLIVYNILGQKVTTLVNEFMNPGAYSVKFDARHLASGVYFYTIDTGNFKVVKKMMLLK